MFVPRDKNLEPMEFIEQLLSNTKNSPGNLLDAFRLLSGLDDEEIKQLPSDQQYMTLVEGLMENKIVSLMEFVESFDA